MDGSQKLELYVIVHDSILQLIHTRHHQLVQIVLQSDFWHRALISIVSLILHLVILLSMCRIFICCLFKYQLINFYPSRLIISTISCGKYLVHLPHLLHSLAKNDDYVANLDLTHFSTQHGQINEVLVEGWLGLDSFEIVLESLVVVRFALAGLSDHVANSSVSHCVLDYWSLSWSYHEIAEDWFFSRI